MSFTPRTDWKDLPDTSTPIRAADLIRIEAGIAAGSVRLPYVPQLGRWRTAVARRGERNPRLLVIGDSASAEAASWQHQIAGRRYFDPHRATAPDGDRDTAFANGLVDAQMARFAGLLGATDIDLLVAPDAAQPGDYRYDEGPWRPAWTYGTHWSTRYPTVGPIDTYRIPNMDGADALTIRADQGAGNTWWYGFNATVSDRPLDVMTLAVPGVSAKLWRDRLTDPADDLLFWGSSIPRALADGFNPDLIVIALGANDLDDAAAAAAAGANVSTIIGVLRDLQPNADVALQTYWQPTWMPVRDQIIAAAVSQDTALLDFWPHIPPHAQHPGLYVDEFHLNAAGHRLLADMAADALGLPPG